MHTLTDFFNLKYLLHFRYFHNNKQINLCGSKIHRHSSRNEVVCVALY